MNKCLTEENYINMLNCFRACDLRALLEAFNIFTDRNKDELKTRALELLNTSTVGSNEITSEQFKFKLSEIYMSWSKVNTHHQKLFLRSEYPYHLMDKDQDKPTLVTSHIQRRKRKNSITENNAIPEKIMVDNNIQNTAINYQPVSTVESPQLPSNQQHAESTNVNNDTSNNEYNSSFTVFSSYLKFKKLPFYDNIYEVIKPTVLSDFTNGEKFKFILSNEHVNLIAANYLPTICRRKNKNTYKLQIRICHLKSNFKFLSEVTDYLPPGLKISYGTGPFISPPIDPKSGIECRPFAAPIDCTKFVMSALSIENTLNIMWTPDGNKYAMKMCVVKQLTVENLLKSIQNKGGRNSEATKNDIIKKLANVDPDLATTVYRFSLLCPLSKLRMNIPAKSINCNHLQCFDVYTFLKMNENKPTWKCPTCDKSCLFKDILIENYFLEVITSPKLRNDSTDIVLLSNGTWNVYENNDETNLINVTDDSDIICLDD